MRSGSDGDLQFRQMQSALTNHGFKRYTVRRSEELLGEVFSFHVDIEASSVSWAYQNTAGVIGGYIVPFKTRKEAGRALAEEER